MTAPPILSEPTLRAWWPDRQKLGPIKLSLDLNFTTVTCELTEEGLVTPVRVVNWMELEQIRKEDRKCFEIHLEKIEAIQRFSPTTGNVRSLAPTNSAPTMLVSGIPMHRIKDTDPWADSQAKLKALGTSRGAVLDTCFGLGYTAILASKTAASVLSVEIDPVGLELARRNPWSQAAFDAANIEVREGDIQEVISSLPARSICAIIHDPPTMSIAGELYSTDFYRQLRRVIQPNGTLFHYIGDPTSGLGKRVYPGVIRRMSDAGFKLANRAPEAYGLVFAPVRA
ncbi:MAG: spermine synthase [Armatimonadetes bacterium]|nr:spermine synthase [Armatimonadota bacterium]